MKTSGKIVVVYHFFAHYRGAINNELIKKSSNYYMFAGDAKDPANSGIKEWVPDDPSRFIYCKSNLIKGRILIQKGIVKLALRSDIDTIIFLGDAQYLTTWIGAIIARLSGKRVLFWTIGWLRDEGGVKDLIRCMFYRIAHGLLLYGNYAKKLATARRFDENMLYVVYNSLDYEQQEKIREQITAEQITSVRQTIFPNSVNPMLICTTRLVKKRRLDLLLDAMVLLKQNNHEVNLLLIGDGPEKEELMKFADDHQLSVHFYGECYDEEVLASLIMASNVTVAPGMVGLTAMHSLGYGTPVITHDDPNRQAPEWEAIVPGHNGAFFRFGDSKDLARVISEWTTTSILSNEDRKKCYEIIGQYYNPSYQRAVIDKAISGLPASECQ